MSISNQKKILLVEDEAIQALTQKMMLEKYGYRVITAVSGENAIDILKELNDIDLVLMDIDLGAGINGPDAAIILLQNNNIPLIFLSSHIEPEVVEKTEKITAYGYVVKNSGITILDASIKMAFKLFKAKKLIEERANHFQNLVEKIPGIIYTYSTKRGGIYYSPYTEDLLGYSPEKLLAEPLLWQNSIHPDDILQIKNIVSEIEDTKSFQVEYRIRDVGNNWHWVKDCSFAYKKDGDDVIIEGLSFDISDHKQAETDIQLKNEELTAAMEEMETVNEEYTAAMEEMDASTEELLATQEELQNASEYVENIIETMREPLVVLNSELKILTANRSFYDCFKVKNSETIGHYIFDIGNRQWDIPKLRVLLEDILPHNTIFNGYEVEHDFVDIGRKTILLNARQIFRGTVGSNIILLAMEDITKHKLAEDIILDARNYSENIIETIREPLIVLDSDLKIITANQSFYNCFKVNPENTIGFFIYDIGNRQWDIPKLRILLDDILPHNTVFNGYEVEHDFVNIGRKTILLNARQIFRDKIGSNIILLAMEDITERILAEDKIKDLLTEKELLLREVHHRIKNFMNTIKSIVFLQEEALTDPSAVSALKDVEGRINSMMILYDKLYRGDYFTDIPVRDYIPNLVEDIVSNFSNSTPVKVVTEIGDFQLDATKLQPIGIIINELITNILKYAFIGRIDGLITVSAELAGKHVTIKIKDNGIGMPESVTFENSTGFGMSLVFIIAEQLGGGIKIERSEGTSFVLEFDL